MKTRFNAKTGSTLAVILLSGSLVLSGCSGDQDDTEQTAQTSQSTMAVKQAEPAAAPKPDLKPEAMVEEVEQKVEEVAKQSEQVVEETVKKVETAAKEVVAETTAMVESAPKEAPAAGVDGQQAYSTCVGCHGANGEGGVGPQLNNQAPADIVAKLEKYKAGEQMGPMTGMMAPMAQGLSTEQMQAIAEFIGAK